MGEASTRRSSTKLVKNICLAERCQNGGKCAMSFSDSGSQFTFECRCGERFYGQLCEFGREYTGRMASDASMEAGVDDFKVIEKRF